MYRDVAQESLIIKFLYLSMKCVFDTIHKVDLWGMNGLNGF